MAQPSGFSSYVAAAFNARPFGMWVPPNWIGLAAAAMLGFVEPGVWVLGAGLELGYLLWLSTNRRFQRAVDLRRADGARGDWDQRILTVLNDLGGAERARYEALADRCHSILDLQRRSGATEATGLTAQAEGLGRLTWTYLRLLAARHAIDRVLDGDDADETADLEDRVAEIERRLARAPSGDDLTRSLEGQRDILRQRLVRRAEADRQRTYIDAELSRIEAQVELIREQAALSTDPEGLSRRIDEIAATLGGTTQWIRDQQQIVGALEDLTGGAPPVAARARVKERS
jgi:hypothetical protein